MGAVRASPRFVLEDELVSIRSFRDLRVWQAGVDLTVRIYRLTERFPKQEVYGLSSQMQRAAVSVPSNIAEGHARESTREYLHAISVAQGSLAELLTQLEVAHRLGYCDETELASAVEDAQALARQLFALRNSLKRVED
jgi:four helix bundle protein